MITEATRNHFIIIEDIQYRVSTLKNGVQVVDSRHFEKSDFFKGIEPVEFISEEGLELKGYTVNSEDVTPFSNFDNLLLNTKV